MSRLIVATGRDVIVYLKAVDRLQKEQKHDKEADKILDNIRRKEAKNLRHGRRTLG